MLRLNVPKSTKAEAARLFFKKRFVCPLSCNLLFKASDRASQPRPRAGVNAAGVWPVEAGYHRHHFHVHDIRESQIDSHVTQLNAN